MYALIFMVIHVCLYGFVYNGYTYMLLWMYKHNVWRLWILCEHAAGTNTGFLSSGATGVHLCVHMHIYGYVLSCMIV